nr:hypothetical protein [Tanacetum cinerariifolium]
MLVPQGEGSGIPTEPHHTPSSKAQQTSPTTYSSPTLPPVTTALIPTVTSSDAPPDVSQGEACPISSSLDVEQDRANIAKTSTLPHESTSRVTSFAADEGNAEQERANIAKTSTLPHESTSRVTSFAADEGSIQHKLNELTALCTSLQRKQSEMVSRRKGKEKMVETDTPKKKKFQKQMDIQMARQLEEEMERDTQMMNEYIVRDAKVARIHVEEELQMMINSLDRSNETILKYLQEYEQFAEDLSIEERTQQRKPWSKKQKRDYYMAVIKSNLGWKVKDFKGMTFEELEAKFTTVLKQIKNFIPMGSKEEVKRFKRKGIRFKQESVKKLKTSEEEKAYEEVLEEKVKEMMQLVPIEEVYVEALQVKHPIIDWKHLDREDLNHLWALVKESLNIRPASSDKEMELWVELKRLYEPDVEDQLWTHTQNMMHAPVEWKLYDSCGVHHVTSKDNEIFMLIEKDYPLRKGLAIVMICYKLQVENYSQMANDLILKIYKIVYYPSQKDD